MNMGYDPKNGIKYCKHGAPLISPPPNRWGLGRQRYEQRDFPGAPELAVVDGIVLGKSLVYAWRLA